MPIVKEEPMTFEIDFSDYPCSPVARSTPTNTKSFKKATKKVPSKLKKVKKSARNESNSVTRSVIMSPPKKESSSLFSSFKKSALVSPKASVKKVTSKKTID